MLSGCVYPHFPGQLSPNCILSCLLKHLDGDAA